MRALLVALAALLSACKEYSRPACWVVVETATGVAVCWECESENYREPWSCEINSHTLRCETDWWTCETKARDWPDAGRR